MHEQVRQQSRHVSLGSLVQLAETGKLRPAAFSRPQVWTARQVADLFDSILRGYPIGTLLVVEQPAGEEDVLFGDILIHALNDERASILIDGLQRVTAIVGALSERRDHSTDDWLAVCYDIKGDKFVAGHPRSAQMLPVAIAASSQRLTSWMHDHPFLSESEVDACWRLYNAIKTYDVPIIIILAGAEAWLTAQEIFTRINASGVSLTRSDLARAHSGQLSVIKSGLDSLQNETERAGFGQMSLELAAQCAWATINEDNAQIGGRPVWTRPQQSFEQLPRASQQQAIKRAQSALIPAVQFLRQEAAIPHIRLLPQSVILPNLIHFVDTYGPPAGRDQELLRRWVWRYGTVPSHFPLPSHRVYDLGHTAIEEATSLLDSLPSSARTDWQPDMSVADLKSSTGRINALALLSLRPPLLVSSENVVGSDSVPITAPQILLPWLDDAASAFCELLPGNITARQSNSLGRYLLHPPAEQDRLMEAIMSEKPKDIDSLTGHCIDRHALALLTRGDFSEFVEYREHQIFAAILSRVQSMARWGFRDHGNLPSISGDSQYADRYGDEY